MPKKPNLSSFPSARELLLDDSEDIRRQSSQQIGASIAAMIASSPGDAVPVDKATILVSELFYDRLRARFYTGLCAQAGDRVYAFAYDFMPWLHPDLLGIERGGFSMYYLQFLQTVQRIGFSSV